MAKRGSGLISLGEAGAGRLNYYQSFQSTEIAVVDAVAVWAVCLPSLGQHVPSYNHYVGDDLVLG